MRLGDVLEVRLPENPTTGYRWDFVTSNELTVVGDEFSGELDGGIGAGGQRVVRFQAMKPGTAKVEAANRRSWETEGEAIDSFRVDVEVSR